MSLPVPEDVGSTVIYDVWTQAKALLDGSEVDLVKACKGNAAAGARVRKAFRIVKKLLSEANRVSLALEKERNALKKQEVVS